MERSPHGRAAFPWFPTFLVAVAQPGQAVLPPEKRFIRGVTNNVAMYARVFEVAVEAFRGAKLVKNSPVAALGDIHYSQDTIRGFLCGP